MALQRWYPLADFRRMEESVNRLRRWNGDFGHSGNGAERWPVPLDVAEDGDNIVVRATVPGADPSDIQVEIENDVLTISAETSAQSEAKEESYLLRERRTGSYRRAIRLPDAVNAEKAESSYRNGVLTVTFPKQEEKKSRRIEVQVA
jgi:HSP20 family protein